MDLHQSLESPQIAFEKMATDLGSQSLEFTCPYSGKGIKTFQQNLIQLERVISQSYLHGAVIVQGDFNAYLGSLGGIRVCCKTNIQGALMNVMMAKCYLNAISW